MSNDDLISRKALYDQAAEEAARALRMLELHADDAEWRKWWSTVFDERSAFKHAIANASAVNAKPVVEGEWITKEYMYGDHSVGQEDMWIERLAEYGDQAYCSVCGEFALLDGGEACKLSNFCPNCGAEMRREENNEL